MDEHTLGSLLDDLREGNSSRYYPLYYPTGVRVYHTRDVTGLRLGLFNILVNFILN